MLCKSLKLLILNTTKTYLVNLIYYTNVLSQFHIFSSYKFFKLKIKIIFIYNLCKFFYNYLCAKYYYNYNVVSSILKAAYKLKLLNFFITILNLQYKIFFKKIQIKQFLTTLKYDLKFNLNISTLRYIILLSTVDFISFVNVILY